MTTLSDVRTDIRARLNENTARFWTDAQLNTWINEACRDVARRTETLQDFHTSLLINAGLGKYDLPSDVIRLHRVEFIPLGSDNTYVVEPSTYQEMDRMWGTNQTSMMSYPYYFVLWGFPPGLTIQLYPIPSQAGSLNIYYYRQPKTLTNDTDVVEIPEGWQDLLSLYVEYVAKRKDRDMTWQEAKTLYEEQIQYMMDRTRVWHDQARVMTIGGSALPDWLYGGGDW